MIMVSAAYLLALLGFSGFLWIGLYILTRGDGGRVATLTGITALATAGFFLFNGLLDVIQGPPAVTLNRLSWWSSVLPATLWLHLSLQLNPHAARAAWRQATLWLNYAAGALFILLGMATDLIRDYSYTGTPAYPVSTGPVFAGYVVYIFLCAGFAIINLSRIGAPLPGAAPASGDGARPAAAFPAAAGGEAVRASEVRLLVGGGICFLLGAGYLALKEFQYHGWDQTPALLLLLVGLGAVGATVVIRSTLLLGKDVRRDFLYSFAVLLVLLAPCIVVLGTLVGFDTGQHGLATMLLAALVTAGYTLYNEGREWLDAAFFTPVVREERAAALAYVEALATPPAGPSPELATRKQFDDAVRRALTHLSDPTKLATTPLLNLRVVARGVKDGGLEDNRLDRAAVLKEILLDLLDGLKPADTAGGITGDAHRFYNCLYYPYVQGIGRRRAPTVLRALQERRRRDGGPRTDLERVLEWLLQVDEDTFYKWQRRGSDTIAAALREREAAAGGPVPGDVAGAGAVTVVAAG